jgi:ATP-binding cassette, subfamily A (ABC1), member 3
VAPYFSHEQKADKSRFFFLLYIVLYAVVLLYAPATKAESLFLIITYIFCAISPACSIVRALFIAGNAFGVDCKSTGGFRNDAASISLYGGPLLFLSLQVILVVGLVVWKATGSPFLLRGRKTKVVASDAERSASVDGNYHLEGPKSGNGKKGLRVIDISKSFGSLTALDNVSLEIGKGEALALLGPNGAGKSTMMSLIRGDICPTGNHGDILVEDISVVKNRSSAREKLGVCPQTDGYLVPSPPNLSRD